MISTEDPNCARLMAVLIEVVVLPSPGWPLVTSITFGGLSTDDSNTEVLSTRYASATEERLSKATRRSVFILLPLLSRNSVLLVFRLPPDVSRRERRLDMAGITLSAGSCA